MKGYVYYQIDPTGDKVTQVYHGVAGIDRAFQTKVGANVAKLLQGLMPTTSLVAGFYWWRIPMSEDILRSPAKGKRVALQEVRRFIVREKLRDLGKMLGNDRYSAKDIERIEKFIDEIMR